MAKYLNLQVPNGCSENWDAMQPDEKGKFCFSCQKQVIDFTTMSDQQLIDFFMHRKGDTCGRFNAEQLDRDLLIPQRKIPWLRYLFQFAIPAFLLSLKAGGQTVFKNRTPVEVVPLLASKKQSVDIVDTNSTQRTIVEGVVKDQEGKPVVGASIIIKGTDRGAVADTTGRFRLEDVETPGVLVISSVGYDSQTCYLRAGQSNAEVVVYEVKMQPALLGLVGETVVVKATRRKNRAVKEASCKNAESTPASLSVYANPMSANTPLHLKWQGVAAGNYTVEVISISGALIHTEKIALENWMTDYVLYPKNLLPGNYVVVLQNKKTKSRLSQQVIVVN